MPQHQGTAHVMLTVTDAAKSAAWYREVLEGESVFSGNDAHGPLEVITAGTLVIGFRTHPRTRPDDRFDEARVGVDHIGIGCPAEALERWLARLNELGVTNSGIVEDPAGKHLNFRDSDNIALELFAAAG